MIALPLNVDFDMRKTLNCFENESEMFLALVSFPDQNIPLMPNYYLNMNTDRYHLKKISHWNKLLLNLFL